MPSSRYERAARSAGYRTIAGLDEAGRGALFGPVFAAAVVLDPTRRKLDGIDLNGWYEYDDEGVKARAVTAVDKGILKTFLMSRSPIQGFEHSNGHGRRQPGLEVVSRQSNLIVQSSRAETLRPASCRSKLGASSPDSVSSAIPARHRWDTNYRRPSAPLLRIRAAA